MIPNAANFIGVPSLPCFRLPAICFNRLTEYSGVPYRSQEQSRRNSENRTMRQRTGQTPQNSSCCNSAGFRKSPHERLPLRPSAAALLTLSEIPNIIPFSSAGTPSAEAGISIT